MSTDAPDTSKISATPEISRLERILGHPPLFTFGQAAIEAGLTLERLAELWTSLALPLPDPTDVVFTVNDIEALALIRELGSSGVIDSVTERSVARALGQALARMAEWQIDMVQAFVDRSDGKLDRRTVGAHLIGPMQTVQQAVWRRHLLNAAIRADESIATGESTALAVGFADLTGFTNFSRGLELDELDTFLERFESETSEIVARYDGRVIKMIGDEIMYVADSVNDCARISMELAERINPYNGQPELHVGMAYGEVLRHLGDIHGTVVNTAARLVAIARPGTVLAETEAAQALREGGEFRVQPLTSVAVRGIRHLKPWRVRRTR